MTFSKRMAAATLAALLAACSGAADAPVELTPAEIEAAERARRAAQTGSVEDKSFKVDASQLAEMRAAAEAGNAAAQFNMGVAYDQGRLGLAEDQAQALDWYARAAEQDFAPAVFNLGNLYLGTPAVEKDEARAFSLIKQAADLGYPRAQADLGHLYRQGIGTDVDFDAALRHLKMAASQDDAKAMFAVGHLYQAGGNGLVADQSQSAFWFEEAALRGHIRAQTRIAAKLYKGEGVEKDPVKALAWLVLASQKSGEAARDRAGVSATLSESEQEQAVEAAKRCFESRYQDCPRAVIKA